MVKNPDDDLPDPKTPAPNGALSDTRELDLETKLRRSVPLTEPEHYTVAGLTLEQRAEWVAKNISRTERMARLLQLENLHALAYNARQGRYDTSVQLLVDDLLDAARPDIARFAALGVFHAPGRGEKPA